MRALQVGAIVLRDVRRVALRKHRDLQLDVLNLILGLLEVDDLQRNHLLRAVVDTAARPGSVSRPLRSIPAHAATHPL